MAYLGDLANDLFSENLLVDNWDCWTEDYKTHPQSDAMDGFEVRVKRILYFIVFIFILT